MASSISVEPASEDDWELVEIHARYMEEQMLNQVYAFSYLVRILWYILITFLVCLVCFLVVSIPLIG